MGLKNDKAVPGREDRVAACMAPGGCASGDAFHGMSGGVVQLGVNGQLGGFERIVSEVRDGQRRTQRDRAGLNQIDRAPEAHVFVWRAWVPIDPIDAERFFRWREGFNGEDVGFAGLEEFRHIEVVGAIGSGDLS